MNRRCVRVGLVTTAFMTAALLLPSSATAGDVEAEPILYGKAPDHNRVQALQQRLDQRQATLAFDAEQGYLQALLRELQVPISSQVLVFTKTSLQRQRIGPRRPRALYFNDDTYVGFCQHGDLLEVSTSDPQLGTVYYALPQKPAVPPRFLRQTDTCLSCHGSSQNEGFPSHLLRSVYPDDSGYPLLAMGTNRVNQCTPLSLRWGGWYVSGTSGKQTHLGNLILNEEKPPEQVINTAGVNLTDLSSRVNTAPYLSPHSDIVALMVLEHQTEMHNRMTKANFLTRMALYEEEEINKALGRPAGEHSESTLHRVRYGGEPLVQYLLFSGEAPLTDRVQGTSGFAEEFARRGPRDGQGRSLRDFDLCRRLFRYPCSYLIYSPAFDALPELVKDYVFGRLWEILSGKDQSKEFAHLSAADRTAILEILRATKPGLPDAWKAAACRAPGETAPRPVQ
jgi:hypothetical protein